MINKKLLSYFVLFVLWFVLFVVRRRLFLSKDITEGRCTRFFLVSFLRILSILYNLFVLVVVVVVGKKREKKTECEEKKTKDDNDKKEYLSKHKKKLI